MYYFDVGFIVFEFGYNQSFFGILLIPVTSSFGLLFFWRKTINVKFFQNCRFVLIMFLPIFLSLIIYGEIDPVFFYDDSLSPKSPFLILFPIALSFLLVQCFSFRVLFCFILITVFFHKYFISYHIFCFLTFFLCKDYIFKFLKKYPSFSILTYFFLSLCILFLEIKKINILFNLLYTITFCFTLISFTKFINHLFKKIHTFFYSFNTLYFYLFQGLLFTIFSFFNLNNFILVIAVFFVSHILSFYFINFEKTMLRKLTGV